MSRIANLASNTQLINLLLQTRRNVEEAQVQLTTEKKSQTYSGISLESQRLVNLENQRSATDRFNANNTILGIRLEVGDQALNAIQQTVNDFKQLLDDFPGDTASDLQTTEIQKRAFEALLSMQDFLNVEADGQFIFSGSRTQTEPVDLGLTTLSAFQARYDGVTTVYPTTRDAHLSRFILSNDEANESTLFVDDDNWLTFRRDDDSTGDGNNDKISSIEASSARFSDLTAGSRFTVSGTTSNNGSYTIDSVSSDGTKIFIKTEMLTDEATALQNQGVTNALVNETAGGITMTNRTAAFNFTDNFTFAAAGGTITDNTASGTILANFSAGDVIEITGSGSNNGLYTVQTVAADVLTILPDAGTNAQIAVSGGSTISLASMGNLSIDATAGTWTARTAGAFSSVSVGDVLTLTNSADTTNSLDNDGVYTVTAKTGDTLTVEPALTFTEADDTTQRTFADTGNVTFSRNGDTITAATTNAFTGMEVGTTFTVSNSDENNGTYTIESISSNGTVLTVSSTKLTDEGLSSGDTFFSFGGSQRTVFNTTNNTITAQDSGGTAIPGVYSDLDSGDSLVISGTSFSVPGNVQAVFTNTGATTGTIQIQDNGGGALTGVFADLTVGSSVTVAGNAGNPGPFTVTEVSADGSTITVSGTVVNNTDTDGATFTSGGFTYAAPESISINSGTNQLQVLDHAGAAITTGKWADLAAGDTFTIAGATTAGNNQTYTVSTNVAGVITIDTSGSNPSFAATETLAVGGTFSSTMNDGTYTVASVSSDGSQVTLSTSTQLVVSQTDTDGTTASVSARGFSYTSGTTFRFDAGADTIQILQKQNGNAVSGIIDSLRVGQTISVTGTVNNNSTFTISAINTSTGTITVNENITTSETDSTGTLQVFAADGTLTASSSYYQGDNVTTEHRVDENRAIALDITAINPAFEKAIRALALIAQGKIGSEGDLRNNIARVNQSLQLLNNALNSAASGNEPFGAELTGNMQEVITDNGFDRLLLDRTVKRQTGFSSFLAGAVADIENIDQTEAITRLLDESRSLEASFQAFARIRELSLVNFLR